MAVTSASAEMLEQFMLFPSDALQEHLFLLNPADPKPQGMKAQAAAGRSSKSVKLDQSQGGGDTLVNDVGADHVGAALQADLGAGAGIGLSHQRMFRRLEARIEGQNARFRPVELLKEEQSAVRLVIELTDNLRGGMMMRYLYKDYKILGSPFLRDNLATYYKTSLIGYGAGGSARLGGIGASYAYYPPLRGKSNIEGEEYIIIEPGEIIATLGVHASPQFSLGLLFKQWINEVDDRAAGTTAADDQTTISLYGLDLDQFLFPRQLLQLGLDYHLSKETALRVAAGRQNDEFNFQDMAGFNRLDVRQPGRTGNPQLTYTRIRAGVHYGAKGIDLQAGMGIFSRSHEFSDAMGGAKYEADGREMFATLGVKI